MPEKGVFLSVRGKVRGKTGKSDKEKALYPLEYKTFFLAEKEGFEPSRRLSQPTPLAGEPLRPLGYFSKPKFNAKVS